MENKEKITTKERIKEEAIKLFMEKSFDQVTINDICKRAEVSKHTFYYYYASKDALLATMFQMNRWFTPEFLQKLMVIDSYYDQYRLIQENRLNHFEQCGKDLLKKLFVVRFTNSFDIMKKKDCKNQIWHLEQQIVKQAQERKEINNNSDPVLLCRNGFLLLVGIAQIWTMAESEFDLKKEYFRSLDAMMKG